MLPRLHLFTRTCLLLLLLAGILVTPYPTRAVACTTYLGSSGYTIESAETWTAAASPYCIDGVLMINPGGSLIIGPGVTVAPDIRLNRSKYYDLRVQGVLHVNGTAAQPVLFTGSLPGYFGGIIFEGDASHHLTASSIDHAMIENSTGEGISLHYTGLVVTNTILRNNAASGISTGLGGSSRLHLMNVAFQDNGGFAILLKNPDTDSTFSGLTAAGNGAGRIPSDGGDAIGMLAAVFEDNAVWEDPGFPYRLIDFDHGNIQEGVGPGRTLTILPGTVVETLSTLGVAGRLIAKGTPDDPILFTSTDGVSGHAGGLDIYGAPNETPGRAELDYVISEDAYDHNLSASEAAVVTVTHSLFRDSQGTGIYAANRGSLNVADTAFTGNATQAVAMTEDGAVQHTLRRLSASGNGFDGVWVRAGSSLTGAHTWEYTGIPYYISGYQVHSGATLTLEPGVVVKAESNPFAVDGILQAIGTPQQPITVTAYATGTPVPGLHPGLVVKSGGAADLDYFTLEYGGSHGANLYVDGGQVSLDHCLVRYSAGDGVSIHAGSAGIANCKIEKNAANGVQAYAGTASIVNTALSDNGEYAAYYAGDALSGGVLGSLAASGNRYNAVGVSPGSVTADGAWEDPGIPYLVTGALSVASGAILEIAPGTEIQFNQNTGLEVFGGLRAVGAPAQPIVFTGYFTGAPDAGGWNGLSFLGAPERHAAGLLVYGRIEYGGAGGGANLTLANADVVLEHTTIQGSGGDGIRILGSSQAAPGVQAAPLAAAAGSSVAWSTIQGNAGYGATNASGIPFQARFNYWGAASGPHAPDNLDGQGDGVSARVVYQPFLSGPDQVNPKLIFLPVSMR